MLLPIPTNYLERALRHLSRKSLGALCQPALKALPVHQLALLALSFKPAMMAWCWILKKKKKKKLMMSESTSSFERMLLLVAMGIITQ